MDDFGLPVGRFTAIDVLRWGSLAEALATPPGQWIRVGGSTGLAILIVAAFAIAFALRRSGRPARNRLLGCAAAALALGALGTYLGAQSSAEVLNVLRTPTPKDVAVGGTLSLTVALLGASVAVLALALAAVVVGRAGEPATGDAPTQVTRAIVGIVTAAVLAHVLLSSSLMRGRLYRQAMTLAVEKASAGDHAGTIIWCRKALEFAPAAPDATELLERAREARDRESKAGRSSNRP